MREKSTLMGQGENDRGEDGGVEGGGDGESEIEMLPLTSSLPRASQPDDTVPCTE